MMRFPLQPERFNGWDHHIGGWGIAGIVLMIVLWAVVIVALVFVVRALIIHNRRSSLEPTAPTGTHEVSAASASGASVSNPPLLGILEERYAKGEIDRDEFLQRKQDLGLS